jgi:hypothetical protein
MRERRSVMTNIKNAFNPVHDIAQLAGLAPYSFVRNSVNSEESIDISWNLNRKKCIWTIILFIIQIVGIMYRLALNLANPPTSVSNLLLHFIHYPLIQATGLLAVSFALIRNRIGMREIARRLSTVDKFLFESNSKEHVQRSTFLVVALTCSLIYSLPLYFVEHWMGVDVFAEFVVALAHVTWQINDLQYLNLVMILKYRLKAMNEKFRSICIIDYFRNGDFKISTEPIIRCRNRVSEITSNHVIGDQIAFTPGSFETVMARDTSSNRNTFGFANIILTFREHYNALYEICCIVNSVNGCTILLNWLVFVVSVSINLYHVAVLFMFPLASDNTLHSTTKNITFILWNILTVMRMFVVALSCQWVSDECQRCMNSVQEMLLEHGTDEGALTQLESFSVQLVNNKIEFTVCGIFPMNWSVLCTVAGLVIQYLILLFQMRE